MNREMKPSNYEFRNKYSYTENNLGSGAMGKVFLGREIGTKEEFAIKFMYKEELEKKKKGVQYAKAESEIHSKIDHPNIVKCYETFEESDKFILILEYCQEGTLNDFITKYYPSKKIPEDEARVYIVQMISALKYLHNQKIVHRDLKLENILVDKNAVIKISDFGLSKVIENDDDYLQSIVGTLNYIPPEVLQQKYTPKCDIWSLGAVLYRMVYGSYPFDMDQFKKIKLIPQILYEYVSKQNIDLERENTSRELKELISKMIIQDEQRRLNLNEIEIQPWFKKPNMIGDILAKILASINNLFFDKFSLIMEKFKLVDMMVIPSEIETMNLQILKDLLFLDLFKILKKIRQANFPIHLKARDCKMDLILNFNCLLSIFSYDSKIKEIYQGLIDLSTSCLNSIFEQKNYYGKEKFSLQDLYLINIKDISDILIYNQLSGVSKVERDIYLKICSKICETLIFIENFKLGEVEISIEVTDKETNNEKMQKILMLLKALFESNNFHTIIGKEPFQFPIEVKLSELEEVSPKIESTRLCEFISIVQKSISQL